MSETNGMKTDIAPGDQVSWAWGGGSVQAKAEEVKPDDVSITTHRGNEVHKSGTEDDPAVKLSKGGKPIAKQAHELTVEKEGPKHDQAGTATTNSESGGGVKPAQEEKGEQIAAEKNNGLKAPTQGRGKSKSPAPKAKSAEPEKKDEKAEEKKDEKTEEKKDDKSAGEKKEEVKANRDEQQENLEKTKGKRGRKPGSGKAAGAPKAAKPKKRAATEDGEPRRSKRAKN